MKVYGIEKITNDVGKIDLGTISNRFDGIDLHDIRRPEGQVALVRDSHLVNRTGVQKRERGTEQHGYFRGAEARE